MEGRGGDWGEGATSKGKSIWEGLGAGSPEKCDPGNFEIDVLRNEDFEGQFKEF